MRRSLLPVLLLLVASARPLAAQFGASEDREPPRWFGSAWGGFQFGGFVPDDASAATWDFDTNWQIRGTLEREVASRVAVGVAFSYARLPLTYASPSGSSCSRCAADATVTTYGALARFGGGPGFHQVAEVFIGALRYDRFEQVSPRVELPPSSGNTDFAFGLGYGFGYSLAEDWQVVLVQEYLNSLHERSTQVTGGGRLTQHYTTRLGLRIGF